MHSTTKRPRGDKLNRPHGHTLTILTAPAFAREGSFDRTVPPLDATIWRISLRAGLAFKLICDISHLYPSRDWTPRIGGMLELDGAITLYLWPHASPDSALLLLLLDYGAARLVDASQWHGQAWIAGDLLGKVLAVIAAREHWNLTMLSDEVPGYLLSLERNI